MNLARIRGEIAAAQRVLQPYVEGWATPAGGLMALVALQTSGRFYTLGVSFPESYPNAMPEVHVRKPSLSYVTAPVHERPDLLPPPTHVEPRSSRPDLRHTARGEMARKVRGVPADGEVAGGRLGSLRR